MLHAAAMCAPQKDLAPSAKVRRTTPEVVRAPPRHLLVRRRCCASKSRAKRACAVTQSCRASIDSSFVRRTALRRHDEEAREAARPRGEAALLRKKPYLVEFRVQC